MATGRTSGRGRRRPSRGSALARQRGRPAEGVRDALRRVLAPADAIVLSRERLQAVFDDAVARGRITRDDATDLVAELVRRGRRQADELAGELERAVAAPAEPARDGDPQLPIADYDDLTAAQVTERLDGLSAADLRRIGEHERRNANRKSVLAAVERRLR